MGSYKILKGQISIFDMAKRLNRGETYEILKKYKMKDFIFMAWINKEPVRFYHERLKTIASKENIEINEKYIETFLKRNFRNIEVRYGVKIGIEDGIIKTLESNTLKGGNDLWKMKN